jgi:hypothetical protein
MGADLWWDQLGGASISLCLIHLFLNIGIICTMNRSNLIAEL